jgi:hypothetical protein
MVENTDDLRDIIEDKVYDYLYSTVYLDTALEYAESNVDKSSLEFEETIEAIENDFREFKEDFEEFKDFIESWDSNIEKFARREYSEQFKDEFETFDDFITSEAGQDTIQIASEDLSAQLEEDPALSSIHSFLVDHQVELDDRNIERTLIQIDNKLEDEMSGLKELYSTLEYEVFREIFA